MRQGGDPVVEGPHGVGDDEGLVEIEDNGETAEVEHPHGGVVEAGADGAAPEAGGGLGFGGHGD